MKLFPPKWKAYDEIELTAPEIHNINILITRAEREANEWISHVLGVPLNLNGYKNSPKKAANVLLADFFILLFIFRLESPR